MYCIEHAACRFILTLIQLTPVFLSSYRHRESYIREKIPAFK